MGSRYTYVCATAVGWLQSAASPPILAFQASGIAQARTKPATPPRMWWGHSWVSLGAHGGRDWTSRSHRTRPDSHHRSPWICEGGARVLRGVYPLPEAPKG